MKFLSSFVITIAEIAKSYDSFVEDELENSQRTFLQIPRSLPTEFGNHLVSIIRNLFSRQVTHLKYSRAIETRSAHPIFSSLMHQTEKQS